MPQTKGMRESNNELGKSVRNLHVIKTSYAGKLVRMYEKNYTRKIEGSI